ncbi:MAG TPA: hypothetical protein VE913_07410 [Longimicrobium sp.]|nr:hypothetical protein [Longimicrobium sp.]
MSHPPTSAAPPAEHDARGRVATPKLALTAAAGGLVLSGASLFFSGTRAAGTGTHVSRGFPRSYYFEWADFGGVEKRSGINWLYLVENWIMWAAALTVCLLVWRALRGRFVA